MNAVNEVVSMPSRLDVKGVAQRAFDILNNGGIVIGPTNLGYGMWGNSEASQRIHVAKGRGGHKRSAFYGDSQTEREIHDVDTRTRDMIDCLTQDYDLPLGVVAHFRTDHPMFQKMDETTKKMCTANNTLAMLVNSGPLQRELGRLSREACLPLFGSSANLSGTGTKFRLEDVQPELRKFADLEINWGLRKGHIYGLSATIIDFTTMKVIRIGSFYELISDVLKRHFGVDLPSDPGRDVLPSGHIAEFALKEGD